MKVAHDFTRSPVNATQFGVTVLKTLPLWVQTPVEYSLCSDCFSPTMLRLETLSTGADAHAS